MTETAHGASVGRRSAGTLCLLAGGSLVQAAAASPLVWQMVAASRAELGGELGEQWLPRLTAAMTAAGVIAGGRLADSGRGGVALLAAAAALGGGVAVAAAASASGVAVLAALGVLASLGAGCLLGGGVVLVLRRAGALPALTVGVTLAAGLLAAHYVGGAASPLSLTRGAPWLLWNIAWVGGGAGLAGAGLLLAAGRLGTLGRRPGSPGGRLPHLGPAPVGEGAQAPSSGAFLLLLALAFLASAAGLAAQRSIAALSMVGLPESSFGSSVLAGMALARWRAAGPLLGGLLLDLLGPRAGVAATAGLLAFSLALLSRLSGLEAPWHEAAAVVGVASGMAVAVVPAACLVLLGTRFLGYHYGLLYLGFAFGEVLVAPARGLIDAHPALVLVVVAAACVLVAYAAFRVRPVAAEPGGKDD